MSGKGRAYVHIRRLWFADETDGRHAGDQVPSAGRSIDNCDGDVLIEPIGARDVGPKSTQDQRTVVVVGGDVAVAGAMSPMISL